MARDHHAELLKRCGFAEQRVLKVLTDRAEQQTDTTENQQVAERQSQAAELDQRVQPDALTVDGGHKVAEDAAPLRLRDVDLAEQHTVRGVVGEMREEEGQLTDHQEGDQQERVVAELHERSDGQCDEDGGDRVAAMVGELLDRAVLHLVRLLAVQSVECLVEEGADRQQERHVSRYITALEVRRVVEYRDAAHQIGGESDEREQAGRHTVRYELGEKYPEP